MMLCSSEQGIFLSLTSKKAAGEAPTSSGIVDFALQDLNPHWKLIIKWENYGFLLFLKKLFGEKIKLGDPQVSVPAKLGARQGNSNVPSHHLLIL